MKVVFSFQKNNLVRPQKQNIAFGAGLTAKFAEEIINTDVAEISARLAKKGIPTDFKGNKVITWCCDKAINIFQQLNERYGTHLTLPKGIYVEDFANLNIGSITKADFCNFTPTQLIKDSNEIVPSRTVFFNTFETANHQATPETRWLYNWTQVNKIADFNQAIRQSGTDFFLDTFLHELSHVSHEDRLLVKLGGKALAQKIVSLQSSQQIAEYQRKYGKKISQICDYALTDPLEAVACDMSRTIVRSLDKETLMPIRNPFVNTPYEKLYFWQPKRINIPIYSDQDRPLQEILRNFWNGKFD